MIDLATKLLYSNLSIVASEEPKISVTDFGKIDDNKETWSEGFLDDVYGSSSKLLRKEWESKVAST